MAEGIEQFVKIAPAVWPGESLEMEPGDLSLFVPMGNGLGAPRVAMPWDDVSSILAREKYYGFQSHSGHPFLGAPVTEAGGGTMYFDDDCQRGDIEAMLRLMEVRVQLKDYAAFVQQATKPEDRYLTQMRIVSGGALEYLFQIAESAEGRLLRQQVLPVGELIWRFIEWFKTESAEDRYPVAGALEGDGDWAKESLAFGFMVENQYHSIYRLWTRAWLVTK